MQPVTSAKPRPPAKRAQASRCPLASPSGSRSTSTTDAAPATALAPLSYGDLDLPGTPPLGIDWPTSAQDGREDDLSEGYGRSPETNELTGDSASGGGAVAFIHFPASPSPGSSSALGEPRHPAPLDEQPHLVEGGSEHEERIAEAERPLVPALTPQTLKDLSREELEKMVYDADRLLRARDEEFTVFAATGEQLLSEYRELRDRHDSLLARSSSSTSISTPSHHRRVSSSSRMTPVPSAVPSRRAWRTSLGFPPPAGTSPHHRRTSSSLSFLRASNGAGEDSESASGLSSPNASRIITPSHIAPNSSPAAAHSRFVSSSSIASVAAAASRGPCSPGPSTNAPAEVATLSQANYALTLQLSELEAETERAEREGRKKLRRLEKELEALRADLEQADQRNAALELEAFEAGRRENELVRSIRNPGRREQTPEVPEEEDKDDTPRSGRFDTSNWRARMVEELGSDAGTTDSAVSSIPVSQSEVAAPGPYTSVFLSPQRRIPGQGFASLPNFSASRSASVSSLVPLPPAVELDAEFEAQQDEYFEQLLTKIDELEVMRCERQEIERRLEEAEDEAATWKERCEELEDEVLQSRLAGWEGARAAIAWRSGDEADADSDAPAQTLNPRKTRRPPSEHQRPSRRRNMTDVSQHLSTSSGLAHSRTSASPSPLSSPVVPEKRTLLSELGEAAQMPLSSEEGDPDEVDLADVSGASFIEKPFSQLSPSRAPSGPYDSPIEHDAAAGPAQDVLPSRMHYQQLAPGSLESMQGSEIRRRTQKSRDKGRQRDRSRSIITGTSSGSDGEGYDEPSSPCRRDLALRRLGTEASLRYMRDGELGAEEGEDDAASVLSSNWNYVDAAGRSTDYYPLTLRARYDPRMVVTMWTDTAVRHAVAVITWVRFLFVLGAALAFAIWQGPKKTLGLVDGRRRLRER
ncbi:hypothetical protein JCM10213_004959 [Rhodosporidiobolus nylandii]